jgi:hypothetical protein
MATRYPTIEPAKRSLSQWNPRDMLTVAITALGAATATAPAAQLMC